MCPFESDEARRLWSKACNYHRGSDRSHVCGNPEACRRRLREAEMATEGTKGTKSIGWRSIGIDNIDYWESWQRGNA